MKAVNHSRWRLLKKVCAWFILTALTAGLALPGIVAAEMPYSPPAQAEIDTPGGLPEVPQAPDTGTELPEETLPPQDAGDLAQPSMEGEPSESAAPEAPAPDSSNPPPADDDPAEAEFFPEISLPEEEAQQDAAETETPATDEPEEPVIPSQPEPPQVPEEPESLPSTPPPEDPENPESSETPAEAEADRPEEPLPAPPEETETLPVPATPLQPAFKDPPSALPEETPLPEDTEAPVADAPTPASPSPEVSPSPTPPPEPLLPVPPIAKEDDLIFPPEQSFAPPSLALGPWTQPTVLPGETFSMALSVILTYMDQPYASNMDALTAQMLPYAPGHLPGQYDQTIAALLQSVHIALLPSELPLPITPVQAEAWLIAGGINHGYAELSSLTVNADATPGIYTLPLQVTWQENIPGAQPQTVFVSVTFEVAAPEPAPFAGIPWGNGIVVYTYGDLRRAINDGYTVIYLGYDEANQGTLAMTDAYGIAVMQNLTIDGNDPISGRTVQLVDYNASGTLNGLYAARSNLIVTFRNLSILGHNWYGIFYGTDQSGIDLRFENVSFTGRQMAHNSGAYSTVTFTGCTVSITSVGSGSEHEVAETTGITFYGQNSFSRTGPQTNALFWLCGTGSYSVTIAAGAVVDMRTTDYMIYTERSAQTTLNVQGSLTLTTSGSRGCATFDNQYLGTVLVGGELIIRHESASRPTLQTASLTVRGILDLQRAASGQPLIRLEAGGSLTFHSSQRISLFNEGGGLIASRGSASMQWTAQVINRYSAGSVASVWNNADFSAFTASFGVTTSGGTATGTSNLEQGGSGAAPGGPALQGNAIRFLGDTGLVLGSYSMALHEVYGGAKTVSGTAPSSAEVEVSEYSHGPQSGLGGMLQHRNTVSYGGFSLDLDSPVRQSGSRVYAKASSMDMTAYTYRDVIPSGATFLDVPAEMAFQSAALSAEDQIIPRAEPDWQIVIHDPREGGRGFALYAHTSAPLQTESGDALAAGGLVFVQDGIVRPLTGQDLLIAKGAPSAGQDTYTVAWPEGEGLGIWLPAFTGEPGEAYTTTITWTLADGP